MWNLVAISGKAGSGKDYMAEEVVQPLGFMRWSLAWPMKNEAVAEGIGTWQDAHLYKPPEMRDWLQQRGTERGWMIHGKDYWVDMAKAWMDTMWTFNGVDRFVVPDIRFPHEVEWVKRMGGLLIRMWAPGRENDSGLDTHGRQHSSETALDTYSFPIVVGNDFTDDDAEDEVRRHVISYLETR